MLIYSKHFRAMQTFTLLCKIIIRASCICQCFHGDTWIAVDIKVQRRTVRVPWEILYVFINTLTHPSHIYFRPSTILLWILLFWVIHHSHMHAHTCARTHTHTHTHTHTKWWYIYFYCAPEEPQYYAYYFTLKTLNITKLKTEEAGEGTEGEKWRGGGRVGRQCAAGRGKAYGETGICQIHRK